MGHEKDKRKEYGKEGSGVRMVVLLFHEVDRVDVGGYM